ncbi:MAG: trehalose operon repressor [Corynebacterium sp.]|nr:trehalose operon repressor [Corynebacterium sp.]
MASKYLGIYHDLKARIENNAYPYQTLLPSEYELIAIYDCSRNTVRRALALLAADGYVQSVHGKGVRVLYQPHSQTTFSVGGIETFAESAQRNGKQAFTKVLSLDHITLDAETAAPTGFRSGTEVWYLRRLRFLEGVPLILDYSYFRTTQVPELTSGIASSSVYSYVEDQLGLSIATAKRTLTVERTTDTDCHYLAMQDFNCVAVITSQTYDAQGQQFEYTQSRHRPDFFSFQDIATRSKGDV